MILYHATPRKHLATIEAEGLDPMKSTGKRKEVYLHTASKRAWAVLHTQRRHKTHDVVRDQGQQFPAQISPAVGVGSGRAVLLSPSSRMSSTLT